MQLTTKLSLGLALVFLLFTAGISHAQIRSKNLPLTSADPSFIENIGQVVDQNGLSRPDVKYIYAGKGFKLILKDKGFSYEFYTEEKKKTAETKALSKKMRLPDVTTIQNHRVDVDFIDATNESYLLANDVTDATAHYYTGTAGGKAAVAYSTITYRNIFLNTDIIFHAKDGKVKYDIVLHPGADLTKVRLAFKGMDKLDLIEGKLSIRTTEGSITENIPRSYDLETSANLEIRYGVAPCTLVPEAMILSFSGKYNSNSTTIIDPSLNWSTYYGGTGLDEGYGSAVDGSGNIYFAGYTTSTSNIATSGAYQNTFAGSYDAFLVKFSSSGSRSWATYYGGSSVDIGANVAVDASGNVYLLGITTSTSGISTTGAYQSAFGGYYDAFLVKFSSNGSRSWGTYLGGSSIEYGIDLTTDGSGNIYVAGITGSSSGVASSGGYQTSFGGYLDAFLTKFSNTGSVTWSTYFGGTDDDEALGVAVDRSGSIYLTGLEASTSGMTTTGAYQTSNAGGYDAFLAKFSSSGSLSWGTLYGGTDDDNGAGLATDATGNVYMAGYTYSTSGIASSGAYQTSLGGNSDGFLVKFTTNGSRSWGTFYGGTGDDFVTRVVTDGSGYVYLSGYTKSSSGIATSDGYKTTYADSNDAFLARFSSTGSRNYGTYLGGTGDDNAYGMSTDGATNIYLCGTTNSRSGIATSSAYQASYAGSNDAFLANFQWSGADIAVKDLSFPVTSTCSKSNFRPRVALENISTSKDSGIVVTIKFNGAASYVFSDTLKRAIQGGGKDTLLFKPISLTTAGSYTAIAIINSGNHANDTSSKVSLVINPQPAVSFSAVNSCIGSAISFTNNSTISSGSISSYLWKFGDGSTSSNTSPAHTYATADSFKVTLIATSDNGCMDSSISYVKVYPLPKPAFTSVTAGCIKSVISFTNKSTISSGSIKSYQWKFGDNTSTFLANPTHSYSAAGSYKVTLIATSSQGCKDSTTTTLNIGTDSLAASFVAGSHCSDSAISFTNTSIGSVISNYWNFGDNNTSTLQNPSHRYAGSGSYTVSLKVQNSTGCFDSTTRIVKVNPGPKAGFTFSIPCAGRGVRFTNTSTDFNTFITGYLWNFGDNTTSTTMNPTNRYNTPGTYTVRLKVTNTFGCVDSVSKSIVVYPTPSAGFTITKTKDREYDFGAISSGLQQYLWDFGDGKKDSTTGPTVHHVYAANGNYLSGLRVKSSSGCITTDSQLISVTTGIHNGSLALSEVKVSPDPFSQHFDLTYTLDKHSNLRISILDLTGKELLLISEGEQTASEHRLQVNAASQLAPGLYILRIEAEGEVLNRRIMKM